MFTISFARYVWTECLLRRGIKWWNFQVSWFEVCYTVTPHNVNALLKLVKEASYDILLNSFLRNNLFSSISEKEIILKRGNTLVAGWQDL